MSLIIVVSILFGIGLFGALSRRDIIGILVSVEVILGAALLLLIAVSGAGPAAMFSPERAAGIQSVGLLVLVLGAAEAAVGLALLVAAARRTRATRLEELEEVRG